MKTTRENASPMSKVRSARVSAALTNAARWRLLALLFERPRPGWYEELQGLAAEVDDPRLQSVVRDAARAEEGSYLAIFGPAGAVSPREVAYRPMGDPGQILASLAGFYRAFAYRAQAEDPADHIDVEAGFIGYLSFKEAYALARNNRNEARTTRQAMKSFVAEHLSGFADELARRLKVSRLRHLSGAASVLAEWVKRTSDVSGAGTP